MHKKNLLQKLADLNRTRTKNNQMKNNLQAPFPRKENRGKRDRTKIKSAVSVKFSFTSPSDTKTTFLFQLKKLNQTSIQEVAISTAYYFP